MRIDRKVVQDCLQRSVYAEFDFYQKYHQIILLNANKTNKEKIYYRGFYTNSKRIKNRLNNRGNILCYWFGMWGNV
jgi:hypothetical protein